MGTGGGRGDGHLAPNILSEGGVGLVHLAHHGTGISHMIGGASFVPFLHSGFSYKI